MRQTNQAGIDLIKSFESLRLVSYKDSAGIYTIGWGHTGGVKRGQRITRAEAETFLQDDLAEAETAVEDAVTVDLSDNQFAALVSFTFNLGGPALRKSTLLRRLNEGDYNKAADEMLRWNRADGRVLAGLTRRRKAERMLFLTPDKTEKGASTEKLITTTTTEESPEITVEKKSIVETVTGNEKVKEIAGTGLSTIGNKLATGGISGGALTAIGAFVEKAWPVLIFAGVLIVLGGGYLDIYLSHTA